MSKIECDAIIDELIELAINAYNKREIKYYYLDAYNIQHLDGLSMSDVEAVKQDCSSALIKFIEKYVDLAIAHYDDFGLYIFETEALRVFHGYKCLNDVAGFERYITDYFTEKFGYALDEVLPALSQNTNTFFHVNQPTASLRSPSPFIVTP